MISKEEAHKKIASLIERFDEQKEFYKRSDYNETLTRRDFIDPSSKHWVGTLTMSKAMQKVIVK
jgi:hypothetical protein